MLTLMGNTAFCDPTKVARVVYPAALVPVHGGRHIHQDWSVIGAQDMFTVWTPLMDIPRTLGGLALRPGSQAGPLLRAHILDEDQPGWATTDYRAGDVVVFHCLTAHASLPNRSTGRVSAELRWQLADDPVPRHLVYGPRGNGGVELFSRLFRRSGMVATGARRPPLRRRPAGARWGPRRSIALRRFLRRGRQPARRLPPRVAPH